MDLRVLQYFLAVAREQTISGAAEALHMTQPPLSRQLKELEEELGRQLFLRGSRQITLTREGMLLRRRAEEILALVEKTKSEVRSVDETVEGDVFIGGGESEGMRPIARAVAAVRRDHPGIRFHFYSGDGYDVAERLDQGLLDFGAFIEPTDVRKYDSLRLPRPDAWGLLMRRDDPLAGREAITPADLLQVPLLPSRQLMGENGLAGWLGCDAAQLHIVSTGNLLTNLLLLVEEGVGCALTLDGLARNRGENLVFRPLAPRLVSWIFLVWKKYPLFTPAAELFLRRLKAELDGSASA